MGHPRMPQLVNSSPDSVKMRPGHLYRLHTMESERLTCLLRLSQQQQYMCVVESLQPSAQPQIAAFRFWNEWEPLVSSYTWAPMLMAHPAPNCNTGRTAHQHTSPRIRKWPVAPHLDGNLNLNLLQSHLPDHLRTLRTLVLSRKHPGHSHAHELSYMYNYSNSIFIYV